MLHYVYVIENLVNGKIYIGKHSTPIIDDGYFGSGKALRAAIKKYGVECFEKTIIKECSSAEEAFQIEAEIVDEEFVSSVMTYNLRAGGKGGLGKTKTSGWKRVNDDISFEERSKRSKELWKRSDYRKKMIAISSSKERNEKISKGVKKWRSENKQIHSEETKRRIGEANSKHQSGSGNSQYGTVWIHSLEEKRSMRVKKTDVEWYLDRGWSKGRKINWKSNQSGTEPASKAVRA
jgi:hypothetical protein